MPPPPPASASATLKLSMLSYLEKHDVAGVLNVLVNKVGADQPDDPCAYLAAELAKWPGSCPQQSPPVRYSQTRAALALLSEPLWHLKWARLIPKMEHQASELGAPDPKMEHQASELCVPGP